MGDPRGRLLRLAGEARKRLATDRALRRQDAKQYQTPQSQIG